MLLAVLVPVCSGQLNSGLGLIILTTIRVKLSAFWIGSFTFKNYFMPVGYIFCFMSVPKFWTLEESVLPTLQNEEQNGMYTSELLIIS